MLNFFKNFVVFSNNKKKIVKENIESSRKKKIQK